ncbi:MAG: hypothetical protein ACRD1A_02690 [Terriglobales bacterium]
MESGDIQPLAVLAMESAASAPSLPPAAERAAGGVQFVRNPAAVPLLLAMARDGQPAFRLAALDALWPNHPPAAAATPVYRNALLDGTPDEQNAAVQGLIALHGGELGEYSYFIKHRQAVIEDWLRRAAPVGR